MTDEPRMYLIRKSGAWYRPNSQGYTNNVAEAGRYTLDEAEAITHPNDATGSRDGMSYMSEDEALSAFAPAVRALRPAGEVEHGIHVLEAVRAEILELIDDTRFAFTTSYKQGVEQAIGTIDRHISDPLPVRATPTAANATEGDGAPRIPGVDGQVIVAASEMDDEQKAQPEWLWHDKEAGGTTYGRWAALDKQAPYIRADLVVPASPDTKEQGRG